MRTAAIRLLLLFVELYPPQTLLDAPDPMEMWGVEGLAEPRNPLPLQDYTPAKPAANYWTVWCALLQRCAAAQALPVFRLVEGSVFRVRLLLCIAERLFEKVTQSGKHHKPSTVDFVEALRIIFIDRLRSLLQEHEGAAAAVSQVGPSLLLNIRALPLHGALLAAGDLVLDGAKKCSNATEATQQTSVLLQLARRVLRRCTALVASTEKREEDESSADGGTSENSSALAALPAGASVDCRGHVFCTSGTVAESAMRVLVNNSWLGVRTATTVFDTVMALPKLVATIDPQLIRGVASDLIRTLLSTKHNGVINKTRQGICHLASCLLRSPVASQLSILPMEMLSYLLGGEGVFSDEAGRVLRRSQGLPHAILPLLEAEDPSAPLTLLPHAMEALVSAATRAVSDVDGGSGSAEKKSFVLHGVNAIHVLKFVFDDKILAARLSPWTERAFVASAQGLKHTDWAVRNSSLMLFSSVVHRVVGDHPSKGGSGVNTSLHDIFTRLPCGMQQAVLDLKGAVAEVRNARAVKLCVFPLLLLFSMLAPDHEARAATRDSSEVVSSVIDLVLECRHAANLMVRSASSRALPSLVPPESIQSTILRVMGTDRPNANQLHGNLLQIKGLLVRYCGTQRLGGYREAGVRGPETTLGMGHHDSDNWKRTALAGAAHCLHRWLSAVSRESEDSPLLHFPPTALTELYRVVVDVVDGDRTFRESSSDGVVATEMISLITTALSCLGSKILSPEWTKARFQKKCSGVCDGAAETTLPAALAEFALATLQWQRVSVAPPTSASLLSDALLSFNLAAEDDSAQDPSIAVRFWCSLFRTANLRRNQLQSREWAQDCLHTINGVAVRVAKVFLTHATQRKTGDANSFVVEYLPDTLEHVFHHKLFRELPSDALLALCVDCEAHAASRHWAVRCLAYAATTPPSVEAWLVALDHLSEYDQPLECRQGAALSLCEALSDSSRADLLCAPPDALPCIPRILLVACVLLHDEEAEVRQTLMNHFCNKPPGSRLPRCHGCACLNVLCLLEDALGEGKCASSLASIVKKISLYVGSLLIFRGTKLGKGDDEDRDSTSSSEGHDDAQDDEDEEREVADLDVLFESEHPNQFLEAPVVAAWLALPLRSLLPRLAPSLRFEATSAMQSAVNELLGEENESSKKRPSKDAFMQWCVFVAGGDTFPAAQVLLPAYREGSETSCNAGSN